MEKNAIHLDVELRDNLVEGGVELSGSINGLSYTTFIPQEGIDIMSKSIKDQIDKEILRALLTESLFNKKETNNAEIQ